MTSRSGFTPDEARAAGERIGIDWGSAPFDLEQFRMGMDVELEHGARDPQTNVTGDDVIMTAKIARAHLNEFPDYYTRLAKMEAEAEADRHARGGERRHHADQCRRSPSTASSVSSRIWARRRWRDQPYLGGYCRGRPRDRVLLRPRLTRELLVPRQVVFIGFHAGGQPIRPAQPLEHG